MPPLSQSQFAAGGGGALLRAGRAAVPREGLNALAQRSEQEMPEFEDYATRADMAYLNSRLDALVMSSAPAGTTLSQMTMPPPRPLHPPLIVGGLPPPGYLCGNGTRAVLSHGDAVANGTRDMMEEQNRLYLRL